jgi:molecular chaperone GrpE
MARDTQGSPEEPQGESSAADSAADSGADSAAADSAAAEDASELSAEESLADGIEEDELTVQDILDAAEPVDEHLADLKRVTAEYANYRKRTEANRNVERERVTGEAIKGLIPVLDDLGRAEKHGDLEADTAFGTIAAKLRATVERMGLTSFGEVGDLFDPNVHEAVFQIPTPGIETETVADVVETGYYLGSTLLRVAKVVVQVPSDG